MTRFSDNILSGYQSITLAKSSESPVVLSKDFDFNATTGSTTISGVFPPGTRNLSAELFVTAQGSANSSNKITVSAGGTTLLTVSSFGSANGIACQTAAGFATFAYVASACADVPVPTSSDNGGEVPFSVTFLKDAGDSTGRCRLALYFNRKDASFD